MNIKSKKTALLLVTKMKILAGPKKAYDAFVNPEQISNFWFSSSSAKWKTGETVTLTYKEYDPKFTTDIYIVKATPNKEIVFNWDNNVVTILFEKSGKNTVVTAIEKGWKENEDDLMAKLLDRKEGWTYMLCCLKAYLENGITTLRVGLLK